MSQSAQVFVKTPLGSDALVSDRAALPPPARQLLILVDGKRSIGELETLFGQEPVRRFLPLLQQKAYVQSQDDIFGPATAVPVRNTIAGPPREPAQAPVPAPPPADLPVQPAKHSSAPLVLSLVAIGVAALGFGIWYNQQVHRVPEETTEATASPVADAAPQNLPPPPAAAVPAPITSSAPPAVPAPMAPDAASLAAAARPLGAARPSAPAVTVPPPAGVPARRAQEATPPPRASAEAAGPSTLPPPRVTQLPKVVEVPQAAPVATVNAAGTTDDVAASSAGGSAAGPARPATGATGSAGAAPASNSAGSATPVVLHARNRPLPQLPKRARRADVTTGMAIVRLHVSATGSVDKVELVSAKPVQVYDDQVAATLMQWTFDPPGQATQTTVELEFKP